MAAVLFRDRTVEVAAWLEQRRALGQDRFDEVWEGVYVVNPAPRPRHACLVMAFGRIVGDAVDAAGLVLADATNIGNPDDCRIPDVTIFDPADETVGRAFLHRAVVAVEIRSPREDVEAKLPFYLACGVAEVVVVDDDSRSLQWLVAGPDGWVATDRSPSLGLAVDDVRAALWP